MADDAHLLIVDDDERIRGLLQKFLMRSGFLVSTARDAAHDKIYRNVSNGGGAENNSDVLPRLNSIATNRLR